MCEISEHNELQQKMQWATPNADKALEAEEKDIANALGEQPVKEIPWYRPTFNIDEHPSGLAPLSKPKKDAEHYGDGNLPEDDYYVKSEAEKLEERSKKAED